jgi:RNA polymerase sigma-70 factor (ECF subfamily)
MSEFPASGRGVGGQNLKSLAVTDDVVSAWFVREILPLEAILMHYLRSNWRNASDVADLRQEVYARVLEAARERIPDNPKRFLLTSARNLLINLVRREQIVPMESYADFESFEIADDAPDSARIVMEREELRRLEAAMKQLPARTREAVGLAYFKGLNRTEIARRMGVTQRTAAEFISRGTVLLIDILSGAPADRSRKP